MAETNRVDPRKVDALIALNEILNRAKRGDIQTDDVVEESMAALQAIGYSHGECLQLLNRFFTSEISSNMQGGHTELPELRSLPDRRQRKRIASFVWWYVDFRVDEHNVAKRIGPEKNMDHAYRRAAFDLGNTDEQTVKLLRWADGNPGTIATIFVEAIEEGELSINQLPMLAKFVVMSFEGSLIPLNLPEENPGSSAL